MYKFNLPKILLIPIETWISKDDGRPWNTAAGRRLNDLGSLLRTRECSQTSHGGRIYSYLVTILHTQYCQLL